jgi:hypothetical protein
MDYILKIWKWLDGKKSNIGASASMLISWLAVSGKLDKDTAQLLLGFTSIWFGGGIIHKGVKAATKGGKQ